jgi:ribosome-binding protein aMBF1 (putative translation factor)
MSIIFQSENGEVPTDGSQDVAWSSVSFDLDIAAKIGKRIQTRRILCRLSEQQLAVRLGLRTADVDAYEEGARRISCRLLLEIAKQLEATPRFFF